MMSKLNKYIYHNDFIIYRMMLRLECYYMYKKTEKDEIYYDAQSFGMFNTICVSDGCHDKNRTVECFNYSVTRCSLSYEPQVSAKKNAKMIKTLC